MTLLIQRAVLIRLERSDQQILGHFTLFDGSDELFSCKSLEPPDLNNEPYKSCIPIGSYLCVRRFNDRYDTHYIIKELNGEHVTGRKWILLHAGNFNRNTKGCILLGKCHTDIDGDGLRDVSSSKQTFRKLNALADNQFYLDIY
jgi:hypothetical protein